MDGLLYSTRIAFKDSFFFLFCPRLGIFHSRFNTYILSLNGGGIIKIRLLGGMIQLTIKACSTDSTFLNRMS